MYPAQQIRRGRRGAGDQSGARGTPIALRILFEHETRANPKTITQCSGTSFAPRDSRPCIDPIASCRRAVAGRPRSRTRISAPIERLPDVSATAPNTVAQSRARFSARSSGFSTSACLPAAVHVAERIVGVYTAFLTARGSISRATLRPCRKTCARLRRPIRAVPRIGRSSILVALIRVREASRRNARLQTGDGIGYKARPIARSKKAVPAASGDRSWFRRVLVPTISARADRRAPRAACYHRRLRRRTPPPLAGSAARYMASSGWKWSSVGAIPTARHLAHHPIGAPNRLDRLCPFRAERGQASP